MEEENAAVADLDERESSSSDSEEMGAEQSNRASTSQQEQLPRVTFDRGLAATHSYLGADLEEVSGGREVLEGGAVVDGVALFPVPHLILMPGQTLPLQSLHPRAVSMFRHLISQHRCFAVINMRDRAGLTGGQQLANVGTLAQVVAYKDDTEAGITTLKLRAVGRQRFQLLETNRQIDGTLVGKIKILPEVMLPPALRNAQPQSLARFSARVSKGNDSKRSFYPSRFHKYWAAELTPWPRHLYRQYDIDVVVVELVEELCSWHEQAKLERLAENRADFSYWVASNLPIDDDTKIQLLGINCCLQRLRCQLQLIRKCTVFCCRACGARVGEKADVLCMSVDGPMGAFVNPHGFVHEMLTLSHATNLLSRGRPTTLNSWFPGYAWTIVECYRCSAHMGWRFKTRENVRPSKFWGLTRMALRPDLAASPIPSPLPLDETQHSSDGFMADDETQTDSD